MRRVQILCVFFFFFCLLNSTHTGVQTAVSYTAVVVSVDENHRIIATSLPFGATSGLCSRVRRYVVLQRPSGFRPGRADGQRWRDGFPQVETRLRGEPVQVQRFVPFVTSRILFKKGKPVLVTFCVHRFACTPLSAVTLSTFLSFFLFLSIFFSLLDFYSIS